MMGKDFRSNSFDKKSFGGGKANIYIPEIFIT
jgi:hypothetical protein